MVLQVEEIVMEEEDKEEVEITIEYVVVAETLLDPELWDIVGVMDGALLTVLTVAFLMTDTALKLH